MSESAVDVCVNHPKAETRVRCSSCDSPICVKCMRQSSVGMKCPDCAKLPRSAKRLSHPRYYVKGFAAGFAAATLIAAGSGMLEQRGVPMIGLRGFLVPALAGIVIGEITARGASAQRHGIIQVIAVVATLVGLFAGLLLVGASPTSIIFGGYGLGFLITAAFAAFRAGR